MMTVSADVQSYAGSFGFAADADQWLTAYVPWLADQPAGGKRLDQRLAEHGPVLAGAALNLAADVLLEACVVALYLMFLLMGAAEFPDRVRKAYSPERAEEFYGRLNDLIAEYWGGPERVAIEDPHPPRLCLAAVIFRDPLDRDRGSAKP